MVKKILKEFKCCYCKRDYKIAIEENGKRFCSYMCKEFVSTHKRIYTRHTLNRL